MSLPTAVVPALTVRIADEPARSLRLHNISARGTLELDGETLAFALPEGEHCYLSSDACASFAAPPPADSGVALRPADHYAVRGDVAAMGGTVTVYLIEYSATERLQHAARVLRGGPFELMLATHPAHARLRIAIKLSGRGQVRLGTVGFEPRPVSRELAGLAPDVAALRRALRDLPPAPLLSFAEASPMRPQVCLGPEAVAAALDDRYIVVDTFCRLAPPVDWQSLCGPVAGAATPTAADRYWAMHLHSWFFAEPVLRQHDAEGYGAAAVKLQQLACVWLDAHPPPPDGAATTAWLPATVAARTVYLAWLLRATAGLEHVAEDSWAQLAAGVAAHVEWLREPSNYPAGQYKGLLVDYAVWAAAKLLPVLAAAERWCDEARRRALGTLQTVVVAGEGYYLGHSTATHLQVERLVEHMVAVGFLTAAPALALLQDMKRTTLWLAGPDGCIPQFGDSEAMSRPAASADSQRGLEVWWRSGLASVRQESGQLWLTAGYHSTRNKHADELSMCLFDRGQPILVDAGNSGFAYETAERRFCTAARAHSTLIVADREFEPRGTKPYGSGLLAAGVGDGWFGLLGENPLLTAQGARHERLLLYRPGCTLVIVDRVLGTQPVVTTRYLHFAPDISLVHWQRGWVSGRCPDGQVFQVQDWPNSADASCLLECGSRAPRMQGFVFPRMQTAVENCVASWRAEGQTTLALILLFDSGRALADRQLVSVQWGDAAGEERIACAFAVGGIEVRRSGRELSFLAPDSAR